MRSLLITSSAFAADINIAVLDGERVFQESVMVASRYENLAKQVEEAEGGLQGLVKDLKRLETTKLFLRTAHSLSS